MYSKKAVFNHTLFVVFLLLTKIWIKKNRYQLCSLPPLQNFTPFGMTSRNPTSCTKLKNVRVLSLPIEWGKSKPNAVLKCARNIIYSWKFNDYTQFLDKQRSQRKRVNKHDIGFSFTHHFGLNKKWKGEGMRYVYRTISIYREVEAKEDGVEERESRG